MTEEEIVRAIGKVGEIFTDERDDRIREVVWNIARHLQLEPGAYDTTLGILHDIELRVISTVAELEDATNDSELEQ